jgi:hypothetical protein
MSDKATPSGLVQRVTFRHEVATPRPWQHEQNAVKAGPVLIATASTERDNYAANAALIVRAVNAHDGLVEALRTLANNKLSDHNCGSVELAGKRVRNIALAALRAAGVEP